MRRFLLMILMLLFVMPVYAIGEKPLTDDDTGTILSWPVPMPTQEQIEAAQNCDFQPADRYPESLPADDLRDAYEPQTPCDWAALAIAYADRAQGESPTDEALDAVTQAVTGNPALAFSIHMLIGYWNQLSLVPAPDITQQPVESVRIQFSYGGLGSYVMYDVTIVLDDGVYTATGSVSEMQDFSDDNNSNEYDLDSVASAEMVNGLGPAFTNLLPISKPFQDIPCWDNYPDWTVDVTFEDGTTLRMFTNGNNVLDAGGPWMTEIDGQAYMQWGPDFLLALLDLAESLELPFGQTAAMGCGSIRDPLTYVYEP